MQILIKRTFFIGTAFLLFVLASCKKDDNVGEVKGEQYFAENVAIFDVRNRSLNETQYVKEIHFVDFGSTKEFPLLFTYAGKEYKDDGTGNDVRAADGIFTSAQVLAHGSTFPYDPANIVRSMTEKMQVMSGFKHSNDLQKFDRDFGIPRPKPTELIEVTCKIKGGTSGCKAEEWGWCEKCCFSVSDCEITIGI